MVKKHLNLRNKMLVELSSKFSDISQEKDQKQCSENKPSYQNTKLWVQSVVVTGCSHITIQKQILILTVKVYLA